MYELCELDGAGKVEFVSTNFRRSGFSHPKLIIYKYFNKFLYLRLILCFSILYIWGS